MIKTITILFIICLLAGCQSWPVTAFDIANEPYDSINNNCVHKADKFIVLEPELIEPKIWVVRVPKRGLHAWVFIKDDGGWWVDPTNGIWERILSNGTALYILNKGNL